MCAEIWQALLGFERNITHLDGHVVSVKRPGTTQPGRLQTRGTHLECSSSMDRLRGSIQRRRRKCVFPFRLWLVLIFGGRCQPMAHYRKVTYTWNIRWSCRLLSRTRPEKVSIIGEWRYANLIPQNRSRVCVCRLER